VSTDVAVRSLSGVQKAALVLMNMSTDRAAAVLKNFGEAEALEITAEMARMRTSDGRDAQIAIEEFRQASAKPVSEKPRAGRTGKVVATELITASFTPEQAADMLEKIDAPVGAASFRFLEKSTPSEIAKLLRAESPETVAFVLVQLAPEQAAKVLMEHEGDRRLDIAQCVATMGTPVPEAAGIVSDALKATIRAASGRGAITAGDDDDDEPELTPAQAMQVQYLVDIMNHADPAQEIEIMDALRERDPVLADAVRAKMLSFDDVPRLQDRDLQTLLRGLDVSLLALALKGAAAEIGDAMKANMSERNRTALAEETTELGRVTKSSVEEARNQVVKALRALAASEDLELKKVVGDEPETAEAAEVEADEVEPEPEEEYVD
jgi:flagellar motor switch protein FliG